MSHHATARLFVALDLPDYAREALLAWARGVARMSDNPPAYRQRASSAERPRAGALRVLDPETFHLTLAFLGEQPLEWIDPLGALVEGWDQLELDALRVGAPRWLPARRPRALAVEVHEQGDGLRRLRQALLRGLDPLVIEPAQPHGSGARRSFHPHITVARMSKGAQPYERLLPPTPSLSFLPERLVLYRSYLAPGGARHLALAASAKFSLRRAYEHTFRPGRPLTSRSQPRKRSFDDGNSNGERHGDRD
jgi:2'-5' RNA ligase